MRHRVLPRGRIAMCRSGPGGWVSETDQWELLSPSGPSTLQPNDSERMPWRRLHSSYWADGSGFRCSGRSQAPSGRLGEFPLFVRFPRVLGRRSYEHEHSRMVLLGIYRLTCEDSSSNPDLIKRKTMYPVKTCRNRIYYSI